MDQATREHFDALVDRVVDALPRQLKYLLGEVPLIVEDHPSDPIMQEFEMESRDELCGLHDGIALTERTAEDPPELPGEVIIYREGIIAHTRDLYGQVTDEGLIEQIRITILHEIGHHFGLDEDKLAELGYD